MSISDKEEQENQPTITAFPTSPASQIMKGRGSNIFAAEAGPYFSSTKIYDNLYLADKQTLLSPRIDSKMDRGFFLAEDDWTCYRRNYFQVSSVFSLYDYDNQVHNEPQLLYIKDEDMMIHPVQRFLLGLSAKTSSGTKPVELIQQTPKRDKGPQFNPVPKTIIPGGTLSMAAIAHSQVFNQQDIVTFERIQFKSATPNNGKRTNQQYFHCVMDLYAETSQYNLIKIATCQSAPLVVRGRSPGHYAEALENRHYQRQYTKNKKLKAKKEAAPSQPITATYNNSQGYGYYYPQFPLPPPTQQYSTMQYPPILSSPYSQPYMYNLQDWQRARYNSSSTGSTSIPSPQQPPQPYYETTATTTSPSTPNLPFPMIQHSK